MYEQIALKVAKIKFHEDQSSGSRTDTCGQLVAFRNLSKGS